jgi:DNA repair exonuclease SbcCD ATPase subunit
VNLQEAGTQALERCKELITHAEDAQKRVGDIDDQVEKARQQLQTDWHQAMEHAQQLLHHVKNERSEMEAEAQASLALLRELHGRLVSAEQETVQSVHELLSEVHGLEEHVQQQEPLVSEALTHFHETGHSLGQKADEVHTQLEAVSQETEHHAAENVAGAIGEIENAHDHRLEQLHQHVDSSALPEMEQHHAELHGHIDDYKSAYQEAVHESREKTQQAATEALGQATSKHEEVFGQFQQVGNEAKQILDVLKGGIEAGAETASTVEEALKTGVNTTSIGLQAAVGTLEEMMKFFNHFSFIKI